MHTHETLSLNGKKGAIARWGNLTVYQRLIKNSVRNESGCLVWKHRTKTRYPMIRLDKNTIRAAHRVMWLIVNGGIPEGMEVCHICDNTQCLEPTHLFVGTHRENMQDASRKGRIKTGFSRLSKNAFKSIFDMRRNGFSFAKIGDAVGCSAAHAFAIFKRRVCVKHTQTL